MMTYKKLCNYLNNIIRDVKKENVKTILEQIMFYKKVHHKEKNIKYYEHTEFDNIINDADILYMTRVQRERFADPLVYEKVKNVYILKNEMLKDTKDNLKVLHPLPRVNEIDTDVDSNPKAYYFQQALNGVYARQAIIAKALDL